ncbi:MAG: hypothetical protein IJR50_01560 [Treponema sp.]|nr:hypothetical protein [Treponema sp.]
MKVYLDNCCYNRPYDDQSDLRISLETQAKLFIQYLIQEKKLELVTSYVLYYENSKNPHTSRSETIFDFFKNATSYVGIDKNNHILDLATKIQITGIKTADACHIACAEFSKCDFFVTTDDRILKYKSETTKIINPIQFVQLFFKEN